MPVTLKPKTVSTPAAGAARRCPRLAPALLGVLLGLAACGPGNRDANLTEELNQAQEERLAFNKITLSEADERGSRIWEIRANRAIYSRDRKVAAIQGVTGSFFKDGETVLTTRATRGQANQETQELRLEGAVQAQSLNDQVSLQAERLEWQPEQKRLLATGNVVLNKADLPYTIRGNQLTVLVQNERYLLEGNVVVTSDNPPTQLRTESLDWDSKAGVLRLDKPFTVARGPNGQDGTARADSGQFNLKAQTAVLQDNIQISLADPPLQLSGNYLVWAMRQKLVESSTPFTVRHRTQNLTISAGRGTVDLSAMLVNFSGSVQALAANGGQLNAQQLVWQVRDKLATATGNVVYQQPQNSARVTGDRAVAKLDDQTIQVSGNNVVTRIVP